MSPASYSCLSCPECHSAHAVLTAIDSEHQLNSRMMRCHSRRPIWEKFKGNGDPVLLCLYLEHFLRWAVRLSHLVIFDCRFLFNRIIGPALLRPFQLGLVPEQPSGNNQHTLVEVRNGKSRTSTCPNQMDTWGLICKIMFTQTAFLDFQLHKILDHVATGELYPDSENVPHFNKYIRKVGLASVSIQIWVFW